MKAGVQWLADGVGLEDNIRQRLEIEKYREAEAQAAAEHLASIAESQLPGFIADFRQANDFLREEGVKELRVVGVHRAWPHEPTGMGRVGRISHFRAMPIDRF